MAKYLEKVDLRAIEAEENLLLDVQFLLQELIHDKEISRVELAKMTGISKARLSQIMGSEANPTLKTCARLFLALGEEISVSVKKKKEQSAPLMSDNADWRLEIDERPTVARRRATGGDFRLGVLLKEAIVSNDNYGSQVEIWGGGEPVEAQAA